MFYFVTFKFKVQFQLESLFLQAFLTDTCYQITILHFLAKKVKKILIDHVTTLILLFLLTDNLSADFQKVTQGV